MKAPLFLFCLLIFIVPVNALIIANHTAVDDFDQGNIPLYWIEQVKQQRTLFQLPGQSHAQQFVGDLDDSVNPRTIGGLLELEQLDPTYSVQVACSLDDLTEDNALRLLKGVYAYGSWRGLQYECRNGDENIWVDAEDKQVTIDSANQAVTQGDPIDYMTWGWSFDIVVDDNAYEEGSSTPVTFNDNVMQNYLDSWVLFNANPDAPTEYIYMTAITDDNVYNDPDYIGYRGWRVTHYNDIIRQAAADADGVLFDQADIENWNYDNSEQRIETWFDPDAQVERTLYLRHPSYDGSGCAHGTMEVCLKKAKGFWWLMARLAGWDGTPACQDSSDCGGNACVQGICQEGTPTTCEDADGDGYDGYDPVNCPSGTDCDDSPSGALINPAATETCDGIDNNCDGTIDEGCSQSCTDGEIVAACDCGGDEYEVGYCCSGLWSPTSCADNWQSLYIKDFDDGIILDDYLHAPTPPMSPDYAVVNGELTNNAIGAQGKTMNRLQINLESLGVNPRGEFYLAADVKFDENNLWCCTSDQYCYNVSSTCPNGMDGMKMTYAFGYNSVSWVPSTNPSHADNTGGWQFNDNRNGATGYGPYYGGVPNLFDGQWHHWVWHFRHNTQSHGIWQDDGIYEMYIDGQLATTMTDVPYTVEGFDGSFNAIDKPVTFFGGGGQLANDFWYWVDNISIVASDWSAQETIAVPGDLDGNGLVDLRDLLLVDSLQKLLLIGRNLLV